MTSWGDKWASLKSQALNVATYVKSSVEKQLEASDALAVLDAEELGIAYVTDRMLIIPFPSSASTHIGKPIDNLSKFLKSNYKGRFMIWNLAEKTYDYTAFDDQVIEVRFPGYPAPPLDQIFMICQSIHGFLSADPKNVAVVHCQSGTGRSVCTAAAYVAWSGAVKSPSKALEFVSKAKRMPISQLVIPTQTRYYEYITDILNGKYPSNKLVYLERVITNGVPRFEDVKDPATVAATLGPAPGGGVATAAGGGSAAGVVNPNIGKGCRPYLQIFKSAKLIYTTTGRDKVLKTYTTSDNSILFPVGLVLDGDILIRVRHLDRNMNRVSMFRFGFHTGYIVPGNTRYLRAQLDGAYRDKRFDSDFFVDLIFRSVEDKNGADVPSERDAQYWERIAQRKVVDMKANESPLKPVAPSTAAASAAAAAAASAAASADGKSSATAPAFSVGGDFDDDETLDEDHSPAGVSGAGAGAKSPLKSNSKPTTVGAVGGAAKPAITTAATTASAAAAKPKAAPASTAAAASKPAAALPLAKPIAKPNSASAPAATAATKPAPAAAVAVTKPAATTTTAAAAAAAKPATAAAAPKPAPVPAPAAASTEDDFDDLEDYVKGLGVTSTASATSTPASATKPAATAATAPGSSIAAKAVAAAAAIAGAGTNSVVPAPADDIDSDTENLLLELHQSTSAAPPPSAATTPAKPTGATSAATPTLPASTAGVASPSTALTSDDNDLLDLLDS